MVYPLISVSSLLFSLSSPLGPSSHSLVSSNSLASLILSSALCSVILLSISVDSIFLGLQMYIHISLSPFLHLSVSIYHSASLHLYRSIGLSLSLIVSSVLSSLHLFLSVPQFKLLTLLDSCWIVQCMYTYIPIVPSDFHCQF